MFRNRIYLIVFHIIFPLLIGGGIYLLFRCSSLMMFKWLEFLDFKSTIEYLRVNTLPLKQFIPSWLYFSLPGGLWVYSFTSAFYLLWFNQGATNIYWVLFPVVFFNSIELLRLLNLFPGTFDIVDLFVNTLAFGFSFIFFYFKPKCKKIQVEKLVKLKT